ncbi:MAG: hypothetical protein JPMHGGIA_00951 [Saprospiraceae bacterium]|jgi:hypothetical protein|nr:hypothetical protein [Saprospiraceae bacterium]
MRYFKTILSSVSYQNIGAIESIFISLTIIYNCFFFSISYSYGNAIQLTYSSSITSLEFSDTIPCNRVLDFDGINDYIQCNTPNLKSPAFTIELWFKSNNNRMGNCDTNNLSAFNWLFSFVGDRFGLGDCKGILKIVYAPYCLKGNFICDVLPDIPINDNRWHHFAFVQDTLTGAEMWVDGKRVFNFGKSTFLLPESFRIGERHRINNGNPFFGKIDEFRIWAFKKDSVKINEQLYCKLVGTEDSLITYYSFEQGIPSGLNHNISLVTDFSRSLNHGRLQNFKLVDSISNFVCSDTLNLDSSCLSQNCQADFESQFISCNQIQFYALAHFQGNKDSLVYHWSGSNGQLMSNSKNPEFTFTNGSGSYEVCLTISSKTCVANVCKTLNIRIPGPPIFIDCPSKIRLYGCEAVFPIQINAYDSCLNKNITATCYRSDFRMLTDPYSIGTTQVTCIAKSITGDSSICKINIEVIDTIPPECDLNVYTAVLDNSGSSILNESLIVNSIHDNCSAVNVPTFSFKLNCSHIGKLIPAQFEMKDESGNRKNCSFLIRVEDRSDPQCEGRDTIISASSDQGAYFDFTFASSDNCGVIMKSCSPASGSLFTCGLTTVSCTVKDSSDNLGRCHFKVEVVNCNACCKNEGRFQNMLAQGVKLELKWNQANNCQVQLFPPDFSECQFITQLKWGDGTVTNGKFPDSLEFTHEYMNPGKYKICIQISEGLDSSCFQGKVCSDIEINSNCELFTSVEDLDPLGFILYPNPATNTLNIHCVKKANQLLLTDFKGVQILSKRVMLQTFNLDIDKLMPGIYTLTLIYANGLNSSARFIKTGF